MMNCSFDALRKAAITDQQMAKACKQQRSVAQSKMAPCGLVNYGVMIFTAVISICLARYSLSLICMNVCVCR